MKARNATLLVMRWFGVATMQASTVSNCVHVGCSGWVYKHWRGIFYPEGFPQRRWFERYAEEFETVEINASFYRLPLASTFDKWRDQAPSGFHYAVKVNRFITHMKKLFECEESIDQFIALARPLGPKLGPLLYQLPPSLHKDLDRLEAFLSQLPVDLEHVVEFRHKSWYGEDVLNLLDKHGIGFVAHDMKGLVSPRWASGRTAYVRFHGASGKYWGRYTDEALLDWADWGLEQLRLGRTCWCYFNNDIHGHALEDARTLKSMVRQMMG
jgi:uncharacterized protein YecE (DUF72 family)